jgi:hypothetical protein
MPDNNWNVKVLIRVLIFFRFWSWHLRKTVDPTSINDTLQTKVTYRNHLMNTNDINISHKRPKLITIKGSVFIFCFDEIVANMAKPVIP